MNTFKICSSESSEGQYEALGIDNVGQSPAQSDDPHVAIRCGWSNCDFEIQVYTLGIEGAESSI